MIKEIIKKINWNNQFIFNEKEVIVGGGGGSSGGSEGIGGEGGVDNIKLQLLENLLIFSTTGSSSSEGLKNLNWFKDLISNSKSYSLTSSTIL